MQLGRASRRLVAALATLVCAGSAGAEDRVTVRGAYYREPSTRIVQPMVEITKDLPEGFDVGAHYLLDAITSASVAQGLVEDRVLTEKRNEVRLSAGKTIERTRFGASFRHSTEPDYVSDSASVGLSQGVWDNSGTVALNLAYGRDYLLPRRPDGSRIDLDVYFAGLSYEQALSPTTLAQIGYDFTYLDGYLANQYLRHGSLGRENVPGRRYRNAFAVRLARYVPVATLGFQVHYRLYLDGGRFQKNDQTIEPWGLRAHTVEGRVYKGLGRDLEVRLSYRYHSQGAASFWCNSVPRDGGDPSCYGMYPAYHSVDVKFGGLATHQPEVKLTWDLRALGGVPLLDWFAPGTAEISYGRFLQSTYYGGAHLLQVGYSLPF